MKPLQILYSIAVMLSAACTSNKKMSQQQNHTISTFAGFDKEGHRGCRGLMPENTIPAMLKAIDMNVTTLEMDVVITKDKQVVVSHDPFFNHNITTKPDGNFIDEKEEAKFLLYQMNYEDIKKFDVGLKLHPGFPQQQKMAAYKPLLKDLIDATEKYAALKNNNVWYNIETKSVQGFDDIRHPQPEPFVDLLMEVIVQKGIAEKTIIQSFDMRTLQVLHKKYPTQKTALLIEPDEKLSFEEQLHQLGFTPFVYSPNFALVTPALIQSCHAKGMKVIPWTTNSLALMQQLKTMGVDGLISDYPNLYEGLK